MCRPRTSTGVENTNPDSGACFVLRAVASYLAGLIVSPQCEDDGQTFFSLDDGNTKFSDLIQLVDFYQLNKGVLPCRLKHHCIRVAL